MVAAACRLKDISDTPNSKANEKLHEARRLLHITLEQQTESSVSYHHDDASMLS